MVQAGAVPVFVDCDPASLQMRVAAIEDAITPRTRAILPTHVLGNMCDMASVMAIVGCHDLWVVEDACEALGDSIGGGFAGSIGDIGTFSFYFSHHISTIEGGMVVTENDDLADLLRSMRSHGWTKGMAAHRALAEQADDIDSRFLFVNPGFNLRPTEIGAALGLSQLVRLPEFNRSRARTAAHWDAAFEALVGRGDLEFMRPPPEVRPMHFAYAACAGISESATSSDLLWTTTGSRPGPLSPGISRGSRRFVTSNTGFHPVCPVRMKLRIGAFIGVLIRRCNRVKSIL